MPYVVVTGPASEPITSTEAKNWLKVDSSADDALISGLIVSARQYAEQYQCTALYTQTILEYYDCFPWGRELRLTLSPIQTVTSIQYKDNSGNTQTLASDQYTVDTVSRPCRIRLAPSGSWPATGDYPNAVIVSYTAGHATTGAIPQATKDAMALIIAFLYENREDIPIGSSSDYRVRSAHTLLNINRVFV